MHIFRCREISRWTQSYDGYKRPIDGLVRHLESQNKNWLTHIESRRGKPEDLEKDTVIFKLLIRKNVSLPIAKTRYVPKANLT